MKKTCGLLVVNRRMLDSAQSNRFVACKLLTLRAGSSLTVHPVTGWWKTKHASVSTFQSLRFDCRDDAEHSCGKIIRYGSGERQLLRWLRPQVVTKSRMPFQKHKSPLRVFRPISPLAGKALPPYVPARSNFRKRAVRRSEGGEHGLENFGSGSSLASKSKHSCVRWETNRPLDISRH